MYSNRNRLTEAVSPVVAVILMVAVTVILAAVIGSFVLDLGDSVQANPQAGVTFDERQMASGQAMWNADESGLNNPDQGYEVSVNVIEIENADEVRVTVDDKDDSTFYNATSSDYDEYAPEVNGNPASSVGAEITVTQLTAGDEVTVIGTLDGKEAVLQTHTVE